MSKDYFPCDKIPMYNASSVRANYWNWFYFLENIALNIFEYTNLPGNLPGVEIERKLIERGFAAIYNDQLAGMVTVSGGVSGIDPYNHPTKFTMANPVLGSKNFNIGIDCEVIYSDSNSYYRNSTALETIMKYARLLAESTSSIAITAKNSRAPVWAVAQDENTKQAVEKYFSAIAEGKSSVIATGDKIFDTFKGVNALTPSATSLSDLYDCFEDILRAFYREYGIRYIEQKSERLIVDELGAQDEVLFTNVLDMYNQRKAGIERVNKLFRTNIEVHLANGLRRGARYDFT